MVKLFFAIFAPFSDSCRCPPREEAAGRGPIYRKKRYLRFVLDESESGSSKLTVNQQSNNDAHGYVLSVHNSYMPVLATVVFALYIHIGVGFGVARSTDRAMPEPR